MSSALFEQVARAIVSLGKSFQVETCDVNITSYTQNQSLRTRLDITFMELMLVYPIYISTLDTELLLIGQDLLDSLAPLIDCLCGQLWVQEEVPKPVSSNGRQSDSTKQISSLEELREPMSQLMQLTATFQNTSATKVHAVMQTTLLGSHASFIC